MSLSGCLISLFPRIEHRGFFRFVRPGLAVTKRSLLLIASLPLTIAVTLGVLAMLPAIFPPKPGVTKANFDRIEKGMTMTEVEAIFGGGRHQSRMG